MFFLSRYGSDNFRALDEATAALAPRPIPSFGQRVRPVMHAVIMPVLIFFLGAFVQRAYAQSTVGSTTSLPVARSGARQSFYDPGTQRHWVFYYDGNAIRGRSSIDGNTWSSGFYLWHGTHISPYFSVAAASVNGTTHVVLVTEEFCPREDSSSSSFSSNSSFTSDSYSSESSSSTSSDSSDSSDTSSPQTSSSTSSTTSDSSDSSTSSDTSSSSSSSTGTSYRRCKITLFRGTTSGSSLSSSSIYIQDATSDPLIEYIRPAVALDSDLHPWVAAIRDTGNAGTNRYRPFTMRSSAPIQNAGNFPTEHSIGRGSITATSVALASLGSNRMALTLVGEGGNDTNNIVGFTYNGSAWSEVSSGGILGWAIQGTSSIMHYVEAMAVTSDGTVYIGGSEDTSADGRRLVAKWNGSAWERLGGYFNTFSVIRSLLVTADGTVYAGGYFTSNEGNPLQNIAKWDGYAWSDVGGGTDGGVTDIKEHNGQLFISGYFSSAGGVSAPGVAVWNGASWAALGTGISSSSELTMAFSNVDLYVGGVFSSAGGVPAHNIAKWNGSSWSALGSGTDGSVNDLCIAPNGTLYLGGIFSAAGDTSASYAAAWNGTSWSNLGTGLNDAVYSVTCSPDSSVIMSGSFGLAGGQPTNRIARWNGTTWGGLGRLGNEDGISFAAFQMAQDSQGTVWAKGGTELAIGRTVAVTGGLGGLEERPYSLIPGDSGTAHLVYTDSNLNLQLRTLSSTTNSWSSSSTIHSGAVTSVAGTYQPTTQKLHVWFSEGNQVKYTTSSSPYSSWSTPISTDIAVGPTGLSALAETTISNSVLTTWIHAHSSLYLVEGKLSLFAPPTATPTTTPTATPSTTPTATPTTTHTPTTSPTPTSIPATVATTSPLPPSTATPTLTPPPPPDIGRALPGGSDGQLFVVVAGQPLPIGGTGIVGQTVEVHVDGIRVGSAPVLPVPTLGTLSTSGRWSFELPPLAPGRRSITATYVDEQGKLGATSVATTVLVLAAAPLDFSGTGDTSIATWRRAGDSIVFKIRRATEPGWSTKRIEGRHPAPADYDSDGLTDLAAVSRRSGALEWNITLSSTRKSVKRNLGKPGHTILSGCRFVANKGGSLAVFDSSRRTLHFSDLQSSNPKAVRLMNLGSANILGCGDSDSDGIDEILFTKRDDTNKLAVIGYDHTGKRTVNTRYDRFVRGFVVGRPNSPVPLLAILSGPQRKGRQVRITTLAGSFEFPIFHVSRDATVAAGTFTVDSHEQVPGLFWANNKTGIVNRRLLRAGEETTKLFALPKGYSLVRPHHIERTAPMPPRQ